MSDAYEEDTTLARGPLCRHVDETVRGYGVTETDWQEADDPTPMVEFMWDRAGRRKLRLFAVACCNRIEPLILRVPRAARALVLAERDADRIRFDDDAANLRVDLLASAFHWIDGFQQEKENRVLCYAGSAAGHALHGMGTLDDPFKSFFDSLANLAAVPDCVARAVGHNMRRNDRQPMQEEWYRRELAEQVVVARCVFGNPFRPVTADPAWLTPTVVALADAIYADRAFDRLPILADALEEAGCDHPNILAHCRGDGPHVRGCWVVDLVLGKA